MDTPAKTYNELFQAAMHSHTWRYVEHLHLQWCDDCDAEWTEEARFSHYQGDLIMPPLCPGASKDSERVSKYAATRARVDAIADKIEAMQASRPPSNASLPILNQSDFANES